MGYVVQTISFVIWWLVVFASLAMLFKEGRELNVEQGSADGGAVHWENVIYIL